MYSYFNLDATVRLSSARLTAAVNDVTTRDCQLLQVLTFQTSARPSDQKQYYDPVDSCVQRYAWRLKGRHHVAITCRHNADVVQYTHKLSLELSLSYT